MSGVDTDHGARGALAPDQAATLRSLRLGGRWPLATPAPRSAQPVRVIAVASGKGGVGKSSLAANLSVAFARRGARVMALDGDFGLGNLDLMFGVTPRRTVHDVLVGSASLEEALVTGPLNIRLLPAGSGRYDLANLAERTQYGLFSRIDALEGRFDVLVIDTPSGLGQSALAFAAAAEQVVLVATPEPTALADAYAFAKVLATRRGVKRMALCANMVRGVAEGEALYLRLAGLLDRFVGVSLDYLGAIVHDFRASRAVRAGVPLLLHAPNAPASGCISAIAQKLHQRPEAHSGGIQLFWRRMLTEGARA